MSSKDQPTALNIVDGVDLGGTTCVISGASSGLGRESARALAATGAHVVLTARNRDALAETREWILAGQPDARVTNVALDLCSLASIRAAAAAIQDVAPAIHVLMNNAGVMFTPFGRTADGFEIQFGTNHLGHFELTRLLTPQLAAAAGARVVILSSEGHRMSDLDFGDLNWERREYDKFLAYGASKTANILHTVELDRRLRDNGIRAYAVHPGIVATALPRHVTQEDFAHLAELGATRRRKDGVTVDVTRDLVVYHCSRLGESARFRLIGNSEIGPCSRLRLHARGDKPGEPLTGFRFAQRTALLLNNPNRCALELQDTRAPWGVRCERHLCRTAGTSRPFRHH